MYSAYKLNKQDEPNWRSAPVDPRNEFLPPSNQEEIEGSSAVVSLGQESNS